MTFYPLHEIEGLDEFTPINEFVDIFADNFMIIPFKEIQLEIMKALCLMPSSWMINAPIVQSYGVSGSGKSTFLKLVAAVRGFNPASAIKLGKITPTAIRNHLQQQKFGNDWKDKVEAGIDLEESDCFLPWDDITPRILEDDLLFSILKSGASRATSNTGIAVAGTGTNLDFDVFAPKLLGSVTPLWAVPELEELKRRMLILKHLKYDFLPPEDKGVNRQPFDLEEVDLFNFSAYQGYAMFWANEDNKNRFFELKRCREFRKLLKKSGMLQDFTSMCSEIIAIHVCICGDIDKSVDIFSKYYQEILLVLLENKTSMQIAFEQIVANCQKQWVCDTPLEIDAKFFRSKMMEARMNGAITESLTGKNINSAMWSLGFRQTKSVYSSSKSVWTRI
ncbi:hypothetical protein Lepto7376_4546 [[Leptolyngbya] sp. PCC 7376]|uniref:hypothetical protein n=1 Tax=[Leptolyngbya] sp. PCC 7376 TaxID=111781 RepID=UPI00029EF557|nr:hypothetical protein [[Leptolyngbya] sp. PCC 7376]AFY40644.1 hypothetical protein Lepto7376_4546 [[Leptolyngbya] sp. PCC 7376]